jgi:hypothetical protein
VEAREVTVGGLFRGEVRLLVPRYQRQYVWSKKNWAALWNDIVGAIARQGDGESEEAVPRHFLGAVVLRSQSVGGPTTMVERQVIDGQQRLATLQVLFAAVHAVAQSYGADPRYLAALRKLTHNDDEMSNDEDDRFKVWPTRYDWVGFRAAMEPDRRPSVRGGHALVQARAYFTAVVGQWLGRRKPGGGKSVAGSEVVGGRSVAGSEVTGVDGWLGRLLTLVNHGLRLIVIDLSSTDNPQVIFESLNARGMPLQTSDLVRNHIFHIAESQRLNSDRLYEEHWARFEDGFWHQGSGKGPRGGTRLDTFLAYYLAMELRRTLNQQELYPTFREYLTPRAHVLPGVLARFAAYGELFRALEQRVDVDPYEAQFMARLEVLGTDAVLPLVLHVFGEFDGAVRRSILELIESYLIRRVIVGGAARDYGTVAAAVLQRLATTTAAPARAVREQLSSYTTTDTAWPGDSDVLAFARDRAMGQIQGRRIRLILSVVDQGLRTPRHERIAYDIDELTLEHLMPRSWNEHWPPADPSAALQRARLVFTLGNLTLITAPLNSDLGNGPWARKRAELTRYSRLLLNRSLPDVWDEAAIRARGEQFARVLVKALAAPEADVALFGTGAPGGPDGAGIDTGADIDLIETDESVADEEDETLADELDGDLEADADADAETDADVDAESAVDAEVRSQVSGGSKARAKPVTVPQPRSAAVPKSDELMAAHIFEVLGAQPSGARLTPGQFHRTPSSIYPEQRPSQKAFAVLIDSGTVSGIELTVNRSGHRAVKLARRRPAVR